MKTLSVAINPTGSVTLHITERWGSGGPIRGRQQLTFSRAAFERALREAEITVPWQEVVQ